MRPTPEFIEFVRESLQAVWDDFVADTGCFPDCIQVERGGRNVQLSADFCKSNFAWHLAMHLTATPGFTGPDSLESTTGRPS